MTISINNFDGIYLHFSGNSLLSGSSIAFIGDIAARLGISPVKIRFYEKEGLIAPNRIGRFRTYGPQEETRLRAIVEMREMGISISRIRETLAILGSEPIDSFNAFYRTMLLDHVQELKSRGDQINRETAATNKKLMRFMDQETEKIGA
jgi:DNA-binding transcriptional MerR regulator